MELSDFLTYLTIAVFVVAVAVGFVRLVIVLSRRRRATPGELRAEAAKIQAKGIEEGEQEARAIFAKFRGKENLQ